jgi:hypothetical protein
MRRAQPPGAGTKSKFSSFLHFLSFIPKERDFANRGILAQIQEKVNSFF